METCPNCGHKVELSSGPGRTITYRGLDGIEVPADVEYPVCPNCKAEWWTSSQVDVLSEEFERQRAIRLRGDDPSGSGSPPAGS